MGNIPLHGYGHTKKLDALTLRINVLLPLFPFCHAHCVRVRRRKEFKDVFLHWPAESWQIEGQYTERDDQKKLHSSICEAACPLLETSA